MDTEPNLARAAALARDRADTDPGEVVAAFEAACERLETPCGDGTMVWRAFGEGPPLALLHGGHGSWLHWILAIPALAAHRRVLVADLPGFGASADPPTMPSGGLALAEAVAAPVADGLLRLCGPRFALAGFSFGAVIASRIARTLGDRVEALILVGAPGFGLPITERPPLRRVRDVDPVALEEVHRANLAAMMIADPARIDALAVHIQSLNVPRTRIASPLVSRTTLLRDALPEVTAPITAIYGERDVVAPQHEERAALLAAIQPGSRQTILSGVGHWAQWEGADEVASLVLAALGVPPGSQAESR